MDVPELFFAPQKFFSLKLFSNSLIFFGNREEVLAAHCWELDMRHIRLIPLSEFSDPELDTLLHPASAFDHPRDVVRHPDLTVEEKRAILSSWASDACAVDHSPPCDGRQVPSNRWSLMRLSMRCGALRKARHRNGNASLVAADRGVMRPPVAGCLFLHNAPAATRAIEG